MKHNTSYALAFSAILLVGAGCSALPAGLDPSADSRLGDTDGPVVLPLDGSVAAYAPNYLRFGEYVENRFRGYHAAEDSEVIAADVPQGETRGVSIRAIADGTIIYKNWVAGYGGMVTIEHTIADDTIRAIYGHLDIDSVSASVGDRVARAERIGYLGAHRTEQTDGERQHLHFGLYRGDTLMIQGYEQDPTMLANWINPYDFFLAHGVAPNERPHAYSELVDPEGKNIFKLDFTVPADWGVEYIPSLQALNLYNVSGEGTARERSQILIRYFDATKFLTLNTVKIFSTQDLKIGAAGFDARRYDIEKKPEAADFADQPSWRNERHIVTDFRVGPDGSRIGEGQPARYYVVAKHPELDMAVYEEFLENVRGE